MSNYKHGDAVNGRVAPLHNRWREMLKRCYSSGTKAYKKYGARGIQVCEEWRTSYITFKKWALDNGYEKGLSIDRIDNDGDYCPGNCRFATPKEQARNRRSSRFITYKGETKTVAEWAENTGLSPSLIVVRLDRLGWTVDETLSSPPFTLRH